MSDGEPVRLVLTAEQRELIQRVSGRQVDALEIDPDHHESTGGHLKFLWRLSTANGIPRHQWVRGDEEVPPQAAT